MQVRVNHRVSMCAISGAVCMAGILAWGSTGYARETGDVDESACKEEVLESGEKVCVRTRVISRRVVKRSSRPPERRKKARNKKRRRSRLVVNPSAHEANRSTTPTRKTAKKSASKPAVATLTRVASASSPTKPTPGVVTSPPARSAPAQLKTSSAQTGVSASARADDAVDLDGPRASFRVEAVTDIPLLVGAGVLLETRSRFRVRSSLGVMPQGYLKLSNRLIKGVDADYPEEAQLLMEQAVDDTITWRSQVGLRPFRRAGFYVHAGYTLLGVRGDATGEELIGAAEALDEDQGELMRRMNPDRVAMNSRLHMIDMELGWDFELGERANLRLGAGWAYTLYSKTRVVAEFDESTQMPEDEVELFEEISGKYLDAIYRSYVHPPSLSLAFGVRF
jgi:hypothetical protein